MVVVWHGVDTAAVGSDWSRPHHCHQNLLPLVRQLRLIADEDVVLHRVRDVVDRELQEGPLWDVDQADTGPGGTAVLRDGPRDHCDSRSKLSVLCLVSVVVQSDEVESGFNLIAAAAEHVISADALTSQLIALVVDGSSQVTVT